MNPEVRLSPDGRKIAYRLPPSKYWTARWSGGGVEGYLVDRDVSDWTPLLPASSEDGAA